ncbi:MAG: hypothetical protein HYY84_16150 [Deltaproteobacteria bacterium]|nr:hypothetical protein [Deltaproteobacteria bacterium]
MVRWRCPLRTSFLSLLVLTGCAAESPTNELAACRASELGFRIEADRARQSLRHVEARANAFLTFVSIVDAIDRHDETSLDRHGRQIATLGLESYEVAAVSRVLDWATAVAKGETAKKPVRPDRNACLSWVSREIAAMFE